MMVFSVSRGACEQILGFKEQFSLCQVLAFNYELDFLSNGKPNRLLGLMRISWRDVFKTIIKKYLTSFY